MNLPCGVHPILRGWMPPPPGILPMPQSLLATCLNVLLVPAPSMSWSKGGVLDLLGPWLPTLHDTRSCFLCGPVPKRATHVY